jgi:hypothetical protein
MKTTAIVDLCLAFFETTDDYLEVSLPILLWHQNNQFKASLTITINLD